MSGPIAGCSAHPHLSIVPSRECQPLIEPLTRREAEVLEQLALAESNAEIAAHLQISVRTVESHLSTIYGKLGVQGRLEALRYALQGGMIGEQKQRREDGRRA